MAPANSTTTRSALAALVMAGVLAAVTGCAGSRRIESVGGYVDDAAITASVKSRMVEEKEVQADAIQVETLNGNVVLSGFARNPIERLTAESVAMKVRGVKSVQNNVAVQP
jgi:hyperosmotically inducible periplasmic protein